jgi:hypothetical protein
MSDRAQHAPFETVGKNISHAPLMGSGRCLLQTFQSPNRIAQRRDVSRLQNPTQSSDTGQSPHVAIVPQVRFSNAPAADRAARRSHFIKLSQRRFECAPPPRHFEVVNLVCVPADLERDLSVLPRQRGFPRLGANRPAAAHLVELLRLLFAGIAGDLEQVRQVVRPARC